jgi:hypothetical protein
MVIDGHSYQVISRYVPKDRTFCKSLSLYSRICLAVSVDSENHDEYYQRLFDEMKTKMPENTKKMLEIMLNRKNTTEITRRNRNGNEKGVN